ncbi:hypothetical protein [Pseudomonas sp. SDO52101_S400]
MLDQAHDQAFTIAKAIHLLSDIRAALEIALRQGHTLKQFTDKFASHPASPGLVGQIHHRRQTRHRPPRPTRQPTPPQNPLPNQPAKCLHGLKPLMQTIATEHASQTEENFQHEGRPEWPELSDVTTESRAKHSHWPGQILPVSSNKPYVAMIQFVEEQADFLQL